MTNSAADLIEDNESDRPTLAPPSRTLSRQVDTSDVDATWPDESPRYSFIAKRTEPRQDRDAAPGPRDESAIIRVAPEAESPASVPPIDAYEDERALLVFVDLPGVAPEALVIELSNIALHVRGRVAEDPKRQLPLLPGRREIVIDVPRGTEAEAVDASLRNGLLRIRVDKTGATTRHVDIAHADV